jgi:hypothetical protein
MRIQAGFPATTLRPVRSFEPFGIWPILNDRSQKNRTGANAPLAASASKSANANGIFIAQVNRALTCSRTATKFAWRRSGVDPDARLLQLVDVERLDLGLRKEPR